MRRYSIRFSEQTYEYEVIDTLNNEVLRSFMFHCDAEAYLFDLSSYDADE